ncbi:uncharacterized protein LACBIDRAFT_303341 [Laccaria bicolor S238N-H82]|uniref:Predicted protein n=1 Tax=Laccaria bicolor (strain S238N-H82 / ATCC MYA-4686) TaxID=486041 RepID=B0DJC4_LACBS|nr:uncharacterized protein LACBIDRAFT_303341 [Laccaria bicolor S238N-H82]EDR05381.1 predicted protein [Laccaria bicolor S238N-H82]|eukprot:XP_001883939.1 predicted protein [Laccaria bicolor S238N-H82]
MLRLLDARDTLEDANFEEKTVNANIFKVHPSLRWKLLTTMLTFDMVLELTLNLPRRGL